MKDVGSFLLILLALTACALAFDEYRDARTTWVRLEVHQP